MYVLCNVCDYITHRDFLTFIVMLGQLPGELYSAIFSHIPQEDIQLTVLSLTRVIPRAPIPLYHLYEWIRIGKPEQAIILYQHFRKLKAAAAKDPSSNNPLRWIQGLSVESWTVDANMIINIVGMLHHLKRLSVWIGPNNFAPEHLEEIFEEPFENLTYLGLRFRP